MEIDSYHLKSKISKVTGKAQRIRQVVNIIVRTLSARGDENYLVTYFAHIGFFG